MDSRKDREVDDAISTVEWLRDRIVELEAENEKLEQREKELMDKCDDLNDIIKGLRSEKDQTEENLLAEIDRLQGILRSIQEKDIHEI